MTARNNTIKRVLVLRPEPDNQPLCRMLNEKGYSATALPMLHRVLRPEEAILAQLQQLNPDHHPYTGILCISPTAAKGILRALKTTDTSLQHHSNWIAIGQSTQQVLAEHGIHAECPRTQTSEGVLALPQLTACFTRHPTPPSMPPSRPDHWLLIRGNNGRQLIQNTFKQHGIPLDECQSYQRERIRYSRHHFIAAWQQWLGPPEHRQPSDSTLQSGAQNGIIATSLDCLDQLMWHLDSYQLKWPTQSCVLIGVSQRIQARARALGFKHVQVAASARHTDILHRLQNHTL